MAISEAYTLNNVTVGGTELSIVSGTTSLQSITTVGVYQLFVDAVANLTKTEEYLIQIYEKTLSGGTQRAIFKATLKGVQSEIFVSPMIILMNGWDMTLKKIAGTDRGITASIRKVA